MDLSGKEGPDAAGRTLALATELLRLVVSDSLLDKPVEVHGQSRGATSGKENKEGARVVVTRNTRDSGVGHQPDSDDGEGQDENVLFHNAWYVVRCLIRNSKLLH